MPRESFATEFARKKFLLHWKRFECIPRNEGPSIKVNPISRGTVRPKIQVCVVSRIKNYHCISVSPNFSYDTILLLFSQLFVDGRATCRSSETNTSVKRAITRTRNSFRKLRRTLSFKSSGSGREIFNSPLKTKSPPLKRGLAVRRPAKKHPSLMRNQTTYF